jgi:hypothetical protein
VDIEPTNPALIREQLIVQNKEVYVIQGNGQLPTVASGGGGLILQNADTTVS